MQVFRGMNVLKPSGFLLQKRGREQAFRTALGAANPTIAELVFLIGNGNEV